MERASSSGTLYENPIAPTIVNLSLRDRYREQAPLIAGGLEAYDEGLNSVSPNHRADLSSLKTSTAVRPRRRSETVYVGASASRIG